MTDETFNRLDAEALELAAQDRVAAAVAERDAEWRKAIEVVRARNHAAATDAARASDALFRSLTVLVDNALDAVLAEAPRV